MSVLSEVSILMGKRASDLEKAREIFTAETRSFVSGILGGIRRVRSEPWTSSRVRIDLPREIEFESKASSYLSSQFAIGRAVLRFKKGTLFTAIADVKFGLEFVENEKVDGFRWQVVLVPAARYQRLDDMVRGAWKTTAKDLPGGVHNEASNTLIFTSRALDQELTPEIAFNDIKTVFEFLMTCDSTLADAVGVDSMVGDD